MGNKCIGKEKRKASDEEIRKGSIKKKQSLAKDPNAL